VLNQRAGGGEPPGRLVAPLRVKARIAQRCLDRPGSRQYTAFLVGEQVDVPGGPADNPVGQQRVAAAEGEPVSGRRSQRDAPPARAAA
jgi:hypothetical protein